MPNIPNVNSIDILQCGELSCRDEVLEEYQELGTIFYNVKPCRSLLAFHYQFKARYMRLHPIMTSKTDAQRLRVGCQMEVLGCVDNGKDYLL